MLVNLGLALLDALEPVGGAVADAGELDPDDAASAPGGSVVLAEPEQVKGLEFEHVYVLGLHRGALPARDSAAGWAPRSLLPGTPATAQCDRATRAARRPPARPPGT